VDSFISVEQFCLNNLKVHKIENFFDSDFGIYVISLLFVSYVKILSFYQKNFLIGLLLGEVRFFRVVLGLRGNSSIMNPKYDPILVF
jgi:hypothetical protein